MNSQQLREYQFATHIRVVDGLDEVAQPWS